MLGIRLQTKHSVKMSLSRFCQKRGQVRNNFHQWVERLNSLEFSCLIKYSLIKIYSVAQS